MKGGVGEGGGGREVRGKTMKIIRGVSTILCSCVLLVAFSSVASFIRVKKQLPVALGYRYIQAAGRFGKSYTYTFFEC